MDESARSRTGSTMVRVAGALSLLVTLTWATYPAQAVERVAPEHRLFGSGSMVPASTDSTGPDSASEFQWPVRAPVRVSRAFVAPPNPYGAGHRGVDIAVAGEHSVRAPAGGVVAFAGRVADRSVITISHAGGIVSTLEPVDPLVGAGDRVQRGQLIATLGSGGHAEPGRLHWGARLNGEYINPLVLLGAMPRAVLLPYGGR
ncbi:murein hydrolase activator EnvC family protein [Microbacterium sp.]|jgi:murein DD-endopeptidase MepM/ murein hydrolase activator NlpD|uniref:murein hydrolase activator EnvC family protein n=1 Tax=Microbacterium sp. TaxID=51671 RepID=UPI0037C8CD11